MLWDHGHRRITLGTRGVALRSKERVPELNKRFVRFFGYSHVRPLREQETGLGAYLLGLPARPP